MPQAERNRNEPALKPIGFALAAVVAGLGPGKADAAGDAQALSTPPLAPDQPVASATTLSSFAPDDVLVLDAPLDPNAVPLGAKLAEDAPTQADLFDPDVPL